MTWNRLFVASRSKRAASSPLRRKRKQNPKHLPNKPPQIVGPLAVVIRIQTMQLCSLGSSKKKEEEKRHCVVYLTGSFILLALHLQRILFYGAFGILRWSWRERLSPRQARKCKLATCEERHSRIWSEDVGGYGMMLVLVLRHFF